jgi:biopolymer transport protein ExbB/TolQ
VETPVSLLATLENGLFALAQVLRLPVMALLWVCVAAALFMAGAAAMDWLARRRERHGFDVERWLKSGGVLEADTARQAELPRALKRLLDEIKAASTDHRLANGGLEHILLAHEERVRANVTGSRMLVKVGPSLGLVGTLIPMGTALAALATGNLEAMSGQMIVAFTTTIIGITCGTIAFVILTIRQGWVGETIRELRFLAERVASELGNAGQPV